MNINWRGKEYIFNPRTMEGAKDGTGAGAKVTADKNIYAFDTESVALPDRYEPICYQLSAKNDGEKLVYFDPHAKGLELFLHDFIQTYSWIELDAHYAFMYAHNLVYDWLQLIKTYPDLLAMTRTGIGFQSDYELYERPGDYKVILRKGGLFMGTAPHFTIQIKVSKREWFDLMFRDTFSFFPGSLDKITKSLGLINKEERAEGLGKIDYRTLPASDPKKIYFEKYALVDPLAVRLTAEKIRDLHINAGMNRLRVSSPGYAIAKLYHVIPNGTKIVAGTHDQSIMQLIFDSYAGGRTGGIYHGKVEDITVLDFHSSYPASMLTLPSFSDTMEYIRVPDPETMTIPELLALIDECHLFLKIDGEETDARYPALIQSVDKKLIPVTGKFTDVTTTGVEVSVGLRSGSLTISKIKELVLLVEMEDPKYLPFKLFVLDAYARKENAEKDSIDYVSAKLELNSSYGKLIESRDKTAVNGEAANYIMPYIKGKETEFAQIYYQAYIDSEREDSMKTFSDLYPDLIEEILSEFNRDDLSDAHLYDLTLTKLEYGRYAVPAAASLITATSRARLLSFIKATGAIYWDTDSGFIENYDPGRLAPMLDRARTWLPAFVQEVAIGDALGELGIEIEHASGYLAGTKRYYLENENGDTKQALHGIPTAPFNLAKDMIHSLATGENYCYHGKERPLGAKETKQAKEIGRFVGKDYESQFHLDTRLNWEPCPGGWAGHVKPWGEQL